MNDDHTDFSKENILVVDDVPDNLRLLTKILTDRGYKVRPVTTGKLALWGARGTTPPDLILLDIMMPGMNGYEVCEQLKADEHTRDIPVIFLSALNDVSDKIRAFSVGGVDYITKPFQEEEVLARVETHLNQRRMQTRLEEQNQELAEAARLREDVERMTRHDLKTPLNAIIGFPRIMMTDDNVSAKHLEYLKVIEKSGMMMLEMINLSLDMFRMERGVYQFQPVPVNVSQVIRRVINDTEPLVMAKKRLSVRILTNGKPSGSEEDFSVHGEELLCYSMLANLIKNAFEASPERERITIELADEEEMSVIRIHNRGMVPEDIRDRFFDKYVTSGKKSGTGLGTYSARLIAETQGGSIHLDTSEEKGTTVTVRLPSCQSSVVSCQLQRTADSGQQATDETTLTSDRLKALPGECRVDLKTAAEMTSPKEANAVIDRIREHDEPLADALACLVRKYRFDIIQELF
ncbi:hybrid sensor histidine kinase/response regulator [Desulfobacterales bacterium HSG2]|nr:hybrid sensor histidine kinase/response regulator [Desulfobacterales bacterium HSG2]